MSESIPIRAIFRYTEIISLRVDPLTKNTINALKEIGVDTSEVIRMAINKDLMKTIKALETAGYDMGEFRDFKAQKSLESKSLG